MVFVHPKQLKIRALLLDRERFTRPLTHAFHFRSISAAKALITCLARKAHPGLCNFKEERGAHVGLENGRVPVCVLQLGSPFAILSRISGESKHAEGTSVALWLL
jgi:hypothetical protein